MRLVTPAMATTLLLGCSLSPSSQARPTPSPSPSYRVTGVVRGSCYQYAPTVPSGSCTMHAQIQNEGGAGAGGTARLILDYRAAGDDSVITASCDVTFPALGAKDVAELDCLALANPVIYSSRIVGTDIEFAPTSPSPTPTG